MRWVAGRPDTGLGPHDAEGGAPEQRVPWRSRLRRRNQSPRSTANQRGTQTGVTMPHLFRRHDQQNRRFPRRLRLWPTGRHRRATTIWGALVHGGAALFVAVTLVLAVAEPALAAASLHQVIDNLRNWLVGLLAALATLFLTVGGLRYILAGGDPGEVGKAKNTLKFAALGYAIAALAPVLFQALKKIVGV